MSELPISHNRPTHKTPSHTTGISQRESPNKQAWRFIPRLRVIDDSLYETNAGTSSIPSPDYPDEKKDNIYQADTIISITPLEYQNNNFSREGKLDNGAMKYEIRDEAHRKWWKVFDEYEYKKSTTVSDTQSQLRRRQRQQHNENSDDNENEVSSTLPEEECYPKKKKWFHWFEETDTPEERRLIIKLDLFLCFFAFVMYWVKNLDSSNISNAYVSGMKECLDMKGDDLINTYSIFTVGAVIFQFPLMYLVYKWPTHILLPVMDIGWGLFTLLIYRTQSVPELQVYRFFVGIFESGFYPTIHYLFGCWYKPSEYARRGAIFYFGQTLGALTSGLLQSSTFQHLDGVCGLEGWRWMFIIDAIITFPIAIIGFWCLPGTPEKCYSIFLTDKEIYLAKKRLTDANIVIENTGPSFFSWKLWCDVFSDWRWYFFVTMDIFAWNSSNTVSSSYLIWLKSLNEFSIPKIDELSGIAPSLGFFWIILSAGIADYMKSRWFGIVLLQALNLMANTLLAVWNLPKAVIWFAYAFQYTGWAVDPALYSWAADAMRFNPQRRAITVMSMHIVGQISAAIASLVFWPTAEGPRFLKGYVFAAACSLVLIIMATVLLPLYQRDERKYASENGILVYNSAKGEVPPIVESIDSVQTPSRPVSDGDLDTKIVYTETEEKRLSSMCYI